MAAPKKITVPKVLDLVTLDRVIGGCRVQAIAPAAPPLRGEQSAMLLASGTDLQFLGGTSGFSLEQVGALDQLFAELEAEPVQQGSFATFASTAPADEVEAAPLGLRDTVDRGDRAGTPGGTDSGTTVIANSSRVVNAHVVSAIRAR